jgi:hypothetical protein
MALPLYLEQNRDRILNAPDQQIPPWNVAYDKYRSYAVVDKIYERHPDRIIQRAGVIKLFNEDLYMGFIASMMWGGINATRPSRNGGFTPFERLLNHPQEKVERAIEYARKQIQENNVQELFMAFENGEHKLPGVGLSYYTKLFSFLGEILENVELMPLIFDKWLANAHCALLIQLKQQNEIKKLPYYQSISLQNKFTVNIPNGKIKVSLYDSYLADMNSWANELKIQPIKLEEFLFGESLKRNKRADNPRIELWKIIMDHCGNIDNIDTEIDEEPNQE